MEAVVVWLLIVTACVDGDCRTATREIGGLYPCQAAQRTLLDVGQGAPSELWGFEKDKEVALTVECRPREVEPSA